MPSKKTTIYIPTAVLEQLAEQGERLDRSPTWLLMHAWRRSYREIAAIPAVDITPRPVKTTDRTTDKPAPAGVATTTGDTTT